MRTLRAKVRGPRLCPCLPQEHTDRRSAPRSLLSIVLRAMSAFHPFSVSDKRLQPPRARVVLMIFQRRHLGKDNGHLALSLTECAKRSAIRTVVRTAAPSLS